jgi:hypothetical protein
MVISVMGPHATSLMRRGDGKYSQLLIDFDTQARVAIARQR